MQLREKWGIADFADICSPRWAGSTSFDRVHFSLKCMALVISPQTSRQKFIKKAGQVHVVDRSQAA